MIQLLIMSNISMQCLTCSLFLIDFYVLLPLREPCRIFSQQLYLGQNAPTSQGDFGTFTRVAFVSNLYDPLAWIRANYYWLEFPVDPPIAARYFAIRREEVNPPNLLYALLELSEVDVMGSKYSLQDNREDLSIESLNINQH